MDSLGMGMGIGWALGDCLVEGRAMKDLSIQTCRERDV